MSPSPINEDFDLQILKTGDRYQVNVLASPAGEAGVEFSLPFSANQLDLLFRGLGNLRRATRGATSPEVANAREFGAKLFDTVFSGDVRDCLSNSRGNAKASGAHLRIRLRLTNVPELLDLPWELLFDRRSHRFIALDVNTTLVRHLPVAEPVTPMRVEAPLRALVAISNPRGDLNVEEEWAKLANALAPLIGSGLVQVERLESATFEGLQTRLANGVFHVLHFIGHGHYDAISQTGYLLFETAAAGEKLVGAARLADFLRPYRTLRLVVLNACEGGRASREDPFAGVAQSLVRSAIPAVVAMQFPVTDGAAITFAGAFYGGLATGMPVDSALAAARHNVNLKGEEGDIEWATPVLYMRGDGRLFDIGTGTPNRRWTKPVFIGIASLTAVAALLMLRHELEGPTPKSLLATVSGPTSSDRPEPVQRPPRLAMLNVAVIPDTVGIEAGSFRAVTYRFRETNGVDAIVDSQDVRWLRDDGTVLASSVGNRILGGSFTVPGRGQHDLLDNVFLPPDIVTQLRGSGASRVQLETTFSAVDSSDTRVKAKAILTIGVLR